MLNIIRLSKVLISKILEFNSNNVASSSSNSYNELLNWKIV